MTATTDYPYVTTVHRPGLPDVHLGFVFAHQAEHATWSLTSDFVNTAHVQGTTVTWSPTPDGVSVLPPVPTDPYALAELIAAEDDDQPREHTFPDLFSRLKAQQGYDSAAQIWRTACYQLEGDESEQD
ncbi:hypothetical protein IU459_32715 [Nocardia amamiensis]|uniref:Uncharacterized protein n=1 Tax=Nocardia amamiensis TaxID=404578 RepID=A0ABS0D2C8_9NOCA|nr:hypothetical protein [Nocardia amamiensis]MBF6302268.1 hypothetical protein [Nocardia amamiensis]